jgi:cell division protein FtsB
MYFRVRQLLTPLLFAAVFGYFGYHIVNGDRGLLAMIHLQNEVRTAQQNLVETRATLRIWENRVSLLRTGSLDPDMLDERARALLHVARPDEVVIFTPSR